MSECGPYFGIGVEEEMVIFDVSIFRASGHFVEQSGTVLVKGIMRNTSVK